MKDSKIKIKENVYTTNYNINVMLTTEGVVVATASMDLMGNHWWVNRVFVNPACRRQGFGTYIVTTLLAHANGLPVQVIPGGYGSNIRDLFNFYQGCGFRPISDYSLLYQPKES